MVFVLFYGLISQVFQAVTKDLTSSSNFSGSCVLTFQPLPREAQRLAWLGTDTRNHMPCLLEEEQQHQTLLLLLHMASFWTVVSPTLTSAQKGRGVLRGDHLESRVLRTASLWKVDHTLGTDLENDPLPKMHLLPQHGIDSFSNSRNRMALQQINSQRQ